MLFEKQILNVYKNRMFKRYDDEGTAFYFSAEDFDGLNKLPFCFKTKRGNKLRGCFYFYENPVPDRLVIFDHGMGGGHRSYMREIELIAKKGYKVFSYDHTGCMESEGDSVFGFATSLADLDSAVTALKNEEEYKNMKISVIGHSWGAYAVQNICALHSDITHAIAISGPISVKAMVDQYFGGILKYYREAIMRLETQENPDYVGLDAVTALRDSNAKILIIQSQDDKMVKKECHFDLLKNALSNKENIRFLLVDGKLHNPNYTREAVIYLNEYLAELANKTKKGELSTIQAKKEFIDKFDWIKMTEQDETVWSEIFKTLE
ncbi:MAG: alpha/beta fold hydrolase [Eubacterium sp.]|nr:alpha/beta fold hydrolase [Eubacterium sp.]